jgi:hypothetical protein
MLFFTGQTIKRMINDKRGSMLALVVVFGAVATLMIISGVASYGISENQASNRKHDRDLAFHIAEAGANYYRWHLAHDPVDYQDGTGEAGPYVHDYSDKDGNVIGSFSLEIIPPPVGTTVVTVRSTGSTLAHPDTTRTVQIKLGYPSVSEYVFASNGNANFSATSDLHGKIRFNGGVRFEGTTDTLVQSAQTEYWYYNYTARQWQLKPGIWGGGGPVQYFDYPVSALDFDAFSGDMAGVRDLADEDGEHLFSSGGVGYHIVFLGNGTYDLYRVNSLTDRAYIPNAGWWRFDINTETYLTNKTIPPNGVIFSEDHVWVEGTVNQRVTLAAGRFPVQSNSYRWMMVTGDLQYGTTDGTSMLGLMAQTHIVITRDVPDPFTLKAALLSEFGMIIRPYYGWNQELRNQLYYTGSQIARLGTGWKWVDTQDNVVSGFINSDYRFDEMMRQYPPGGFPVSGDFELISWEEVEL